MQSQHPLFSFRKLFSLTCGALLPFFAVSAQSELRVFPDQYIIEPAFAGLDLDQDGVDELLGGLGLEVERRLNGKSDLRLVTPGMLTSSLARHKYSGPSETVPYDPSDAFCSYLIKENLAKSCVQNFEIKLNAVPNDANYSALWGMGPDGIDAAPAWDINTGDSDAVIAVIDTGVDYNHPDLKANIWTNPGEIPGNGKDDDGNGYIDDVHGMSALGSGPAAGDPIDNNGHGSHCAGTIGARGNNNQGVAGVNWRVKIMGLKFLSGSGAGSIAGAIEAINYMVEMKKRGVNLRISSNSWGGGGYSQALYDAIEAAKNAGIIFVAASGNSGNDNDALASYPSNYELENVVAVAAIDQDQNLASFSNFGQETVDIAAPGVGIFSTAKNGGYATLSGTSMATPHVAGALGLILAARPELNNAQAIDLLYQSGTPLSSLNGLVKSGRKANVGRALKNETNPLPEPTPEPQACHYQVEEIAYQPDLAADSGELISQSDEFSFKTIQLPFDFQFHRDKVRQLVASPNGVLYTLRAPTGMDYKNAPDAPDNSIAVLHTDLKAVADPHGLRYSANDQRAVFAWRAHVYGKEALGDVNVRSSLFPSGVIEVFVDFQTNALANLVKNRATMGLKWKTDSSSVVYAYNSTKIRSGLAVRYTPVCSQNAGDSGVRLNRLKVRGVNNRGKALRRAAPRQKVRLQGYGNGSGSIPVAIAINGLQCSGEVSMAVSSGYGELLMDLPRIAKGFNRIQFIADGVKTAIKIKRIRNSRRYSRSARKASSRKFMKSCSRLMTSAIN